MQDERVTVQDEEDSGYETEYIPEDDPGSADDSDAEDGKQFRRSKKVYFNPEDEQVHFEKGMIFEGAK